MEVAGITPPMLWRGDSSNWNAQLTRLRKFSCGIAAASMLAQTVPAGAQMPAAPAPVAAPAPEAAAPAPDCAAVAAERTELQGLQAQVRRSISDLAFNRPSKRRKVGAADVGRAAAGTAASVLLPFGVGFLLSAATGAATRKRRGPPEPQADVPALIDRQLAIEARLRELAATPCAAAALPAAPSSQPAPPAKAPSE